MEVFAQWMRSLWNKCEILVLVPFSLCLQIILILFGNKRKYINSRSWVRNGVWLAYLFADSIAIMALGVLSSQQGDDSDSHDLKNQLKAFWAPFLLLHLGGPDTITAYALEDNELWLRHLFGLIFQVGIAIYIFLMSWRGNWISILNIPIFVAGIIKYGERIWVLRSASREHFRDSMLGPPDPGPDYAKFMEDYSSKKAEGGPLSIGILIEAPYGINTSDVERIDNNIHGESILLHYSHYFFGTFKRLFADLILSFHERDISASFFAKLSPEKAFKVIEVELGFMYDLLYTKAALVYTPLGCVLRLITFSSTFSVFIIYIVSEKQRYPVSDVIITYILLGVGVALEIYAVIIILSSDWTNIWLNEHKNNRVMAHISQVIHSIQLCNNRRWSGSMSQYNLISFCLKEKRPLFCLIIQKIFPIDNFLQNYFCRTSEFVSNELKDLIYQQLYERLQDLNNLRQRSSRDHKNLLNCRGSQALKKANQLNNFGWSIEQEFDRSILIWHIATDLCYHLDCEELTSINKADDCRQITSKLLSNYMLYLLVICPFMLPIGIGQIRFRDTCAEAIEFFQRKSISDKIEACKMLLRVDTEIPPSEVKGDRSKSVLFDGCMLSKSLQLLAMKEKWELISEVWAEMLSHAAGQCRGNYHAQQLMQGGELLTHVWLLMAHLGITEQFQISVGYARAQLY